METSLFPCLFCMHWIAQHYRYLFAASETNLSIVKRLCALVVIFSFSASSLFVPGKWLLVNTGETVEASNVGDETLAESCCSKEETTAQKKVSQKLAMTVGCCCPPQRREAGSCCCAKQHASKASSPSEDIPAATLAWIACPCNGPTDSFVLVGGQPKLPADLMATSLLRGIESLFLMPSLLPDCFTSEPRTPPPKSSWT